METKIRLKNLYLIAIITIGLIGLGLGSTFAMFTAEATINNPIAFNSNLTSTNVLAETIEVIVPAEADKNVDIVISNTNANPLNYNVWYTPTSNDLEVGSESSNNSYGPVGILPSAGNFTLTVQLRNNGNSPITVTVGVSSSSSDIVLIPDATAVPTSSLPAKTLYNVLKVASDEGLYAVKYTGNHQDSMNASLSTFDIYHYKAMANSGNTVDQNGTLIKSMNNVVFANRCWQMIRTTDTGGVRLLYNGEPTITIVDGIKQYNCGTGRPGHIGSIRSTQNLSGTFKYANSYTTSVSGTTTTYTLTNPTSVQVTSGNAATTLANIAANYPYTCKNTTGTCTTLYKATGRSSGTTSYVYASVLRDIVGSSAYNSATATNNTFLGAGGYMYGTKYTMGTLAMSGTATFFTKTTVDSATMATQETYLYADSYTMSGTDHVLTNPVQGNTITDYPTSWKNKYYCKSATNGTCTSMYYITDVETDDTNTYLYQYEIGSGKQHSLWTYLFADSITPNSDGTVTMNNAVEVNRNDWYNNYNNNTNYMLNKYVCTYGQYSYDSNTGTYTCSDGGAQNAIVLRYITSSTNLGFSGTKVYKYGFGIEEDNSTYKLVGSDGVDGTLQYIRNWPNTATTNCFSGGGNVSSCGYKTLTKSHYTCYNLSGVCNTYYYINYATTTNSYHTVIPDGKHVSTDITDQDSILYESLWKNTNDATVNVTNSAIKSNVESWYRNALYNDYDEYIDDTIYCNDRSINSWLGFNPNGGTVENKNFINFYGVGNNSLSCNRETDKFSVSNSKAHLNYKVGLISYPEMNLLNSNNARSSTSEYWLLTPRYLYNTYYVYHGSITSAGALTQGTTYSSKAIRPAISLKASANSYTRGIGTVSRPYVVDAGSGS